MPKINLPVQRNQTNSIVKSRPTISLNMTLNTESGSDDDAASSAISEVYDEDE